MNYVRCNSCGANNYKVLYNSTVRNNRPASNEYTSTVNQYGVFHDIVLCNCCGLRYMNPRDENIKDLYQRVVDNAYLESWDERAHMFRQHLKILKKYASGKNDLLDVGCYAGIFLHEAQKEGYRVSGIEPSLWATAFAREKTGAMIFQGTCEDSAFAEDSFDIVTAWDVVEHLEDPSQCFAQIYKWLRRNGIIAISTHDISSPLARVMGKRYPWLMRFHLFHFEPKTLSALLLKNNLEPMAIKYYTKTFSLKYFFEQLSIRTNVRLFKKIRLSINTGDMFMIIARKL